ncbi:MULTISPECIES: hypothetical protein [unclassified Achromobacter]|uniref:hypothetical protein n=1 Tax=unclassified Achromobacter TaxID=2626865 RepID=UPI000B518A9D|nr:MULTISPECIES: hypothetical protein [unclassified Achromobacter]OWT75821.1 hypothetical protein CEY04_20055 [Achromobacter sp. HZ28]OWT76481.1 hypothetical protein CEY05_15505 [Achromobacter sp. HZ34]
MSTISNVASFSNASPVAQPPAPGAAVDRLAGLGAGSGNTVPEALGAPASLASSAQAKQVGGIGTVHRQQADVSERLVVTGTRNVVRLKDGDNEVELKSSNPRSAFGNTRLVAGNGNNQVTSDDRGAFIRLGDGNNTFSGKFTALNVGDGNNTLNVDGAPVTSISVGAGSNAIDIRNGKDVGLKLGGGVTQLKGDLGGMDVFLGDADIPAKPSFRRSGEDLVVTGPGLREKLTLVGVYGKGAPTDDFIIDNGGRRYSFLQDLGLDRIDPASRRNR